MEFIPNKNTIQKTENLKYNSFYTPTTLKKKWTNNKL